MGRILSRPQLQMAASRGLSAITRLLVSMALVVCLSRPAVVAQTNAPDRKAPTPLAHWTFDEEAGPVCRDVQGGLDAAPEPGRPAGFRRVPGVFGRALEMDGGHALRVKGIPRKELAGLTFSAWTLPARMDRYAEIYRQECPRRVLFSFQENGTILSLGLDIGGYVECDGPIDPAQLLDGSWHHCAATFDGRHMRVYFDGKEVASQSRPGTIALDPEAAAYIGSLGGREEFFQGGLDDLRIYAEPLRAEDVHRLYRDGARVLLRLDQDAARRAESLYVPARTFAEAMAGTRKKMAETGLPIDRPAAGKVLGLLKAAFPGDYADFSQRTGLSPLEYLCSRGSASLQEIGSRLMDLMMEYRPLTESQLRRLGATENRQWQEAEAIRRRFETLRSQQDAGQFSPEWVEVLVQAGRRVQPRPLVYEAVAPYVRPSTPETRRLTPPEARAALERDWLFQAGNDPGPTRIRQEIAWARDLAQRITGRTPGSVDLTAELVTLQELQKEADALRGPDRSLYFRVREVKRRIAFRNPVLDFRQILLVDMPYPQGSEWQHETRHRLGYMAVPGGRLLVLDGLDPGAPPRQLMPREPLHGSFWRPDLSWDGRTVVFSFKPHNEKSFHLFEVNVDGTGLRQLTDGPYDDLDPVYLPDGHILFSTTRGHTYVRCMPPTNAYVLARCDRDGKDIYLISYNNEPDYLPSVLGDGRVVYTRWEYTDKPLWRAQKLWTMNPDGTQVNTLWGNQSVWPDLMKDARGIPGSPRVMFTGSAHHDWFSGSVGIVDPRRGLNFPDGLTKVTADVPWPECGNGPVDPVESPRYHQSGNFRAYYSPYPLGEEDFLVSASRDDRFLLYLMDVDGNRELIYEGTTNIFHAMPLKPRPRPPVLADRVVWPERKDRDRPQHGVIFSQDVFHGAPPELKGKARSLRVLHIEPKTYTYWYKRPYISTGPVISTVQSEGVKRVLGTVPIEEDGSVCFSAPAGMALHFQLLDDQGRALQTMRSFTGVMPGETRGCLGCHEGSRRAPDHQVRTPVASRQPRPLTPPPWGEDTVSYPRYVRPVLDRYCGKCHQGDGEARKVLDLAERPGDPIFPEPYHTLIGRPAWGQPYQKPANPPPGFGIANVLMVEGYGTVDPRAYQTPRPMIALSYNSRLIDIASSGRHYGVRVDPENLQRLIAWVDAMAPYMGDEEVRQIPDPEFPGVDWLAVRPRIRTAPRIARPGPVD